MTGMGEHRVPMLGSSWRRYEEPARSRDPRVKAVVGALATLPGPEMRPEFRAELRAQLVAITARVVTESTKTAPMVDIVPAPARVRPRPTPHGTRTVPAQPARHADSFLTRLRGIRLGRPLAVATAVIVTFAVLLGGAVVMSKKALPGDALYGLKRASERLELATATSNTEKATDYLDFATTRANEVKDLLSRSTGAALGGTQAAGLNPDTAKLIRSTLSSGDVDVKAASRLLGADAVQHSSPAPLRTMTNWTPGQAQRLRQIANAMPDSTLRTQALSSLHLVQRAQARAVALNSKLGCDCLGSAASDELGPVPCSPCTSPLSQPQQQPSAPGVTQPGATSHPKATPKPAASTAPVRPGSSSSSAAATAGGAQPADSPAPSGSASTTPPLLNLPSLLPTKSSTSSPVTVNSCGASLSILGIGLDLCNGIHAKVGG
jgi:hypothetical protein